MRSGLGCRLTGEHPESARVRVKYQATGEVFLHMLVEAGVKRDKREILHDKSKMYCWGFRHKDQFTRHGGLYLACENSCAMAMEAWEGIS